MPAEHLGRQPDEASRWSYTLKAEEAVALRQQQERLAGRKERPTISRDSDISGGVYEGAYGGEAIVVDADKYPAINESLEEVMRRITTAEGKVDKNQALGAVFELVSERMKYDMAAVDTIFRTAGHGRDGAKIALDTYINSGVGVCRHQALYTGALLEGLQKRGVLSGRASVERNEMKLDDRDRFDGHSWVRYTNSAGNVYILDVAQQKIDTLDNLMQARRGGGDVWDYGRKEDHDRVRAKVALEAAQIAEQRGMQPTGAEQQVSGRKVELEYDENGLIKVPDWVKQGQQEQVSDEQHRQHSNHHEVRLSPADRFWRSHDDVMSALQSAIDKAGYIDPYMNAGRIGGDIDRIMQLPGLNPDMVKYLGGVRALCGEIRDSGRNKYARYHRNPRAGLEEVQAMLAAIPR